MIRIERIYGSEPVRGKKEIRVLADRLWPRGIKKEKAAIDEWLKDIAPSNELRAWFGHDPEKWPEFKRRYFRELDGRQDLVDSLIGLKKKGTVVLLYSSKDEEHNNAVALKEYIENKTGG